jgi:hypothetical protein
MENVCKAEHIAGSEMEEKIATDVRNLNLILKDFL